GHDAHAAFLGQPLDGDVHLPDDFEPAHDRGVHSRRRVHEIAEYAVDPVADARAAAVRLDVDIAGAVFYRCQDRDVDEVHDWATGDHLVEVGLGAFIDRFTLDDLEVLVAQRHQEFVDVDVAALVLADVFEDVALERQDWADF